jgi:hypothetical protein
MVHLFSFKLPGRNKRPSVVVMRRLCSPQWPQAVPNRLVPRNAESMLALLARAMRAGGTVQIYNPANTSGVALFASEAEPTCLP